MTCGNVLNADGSIDYKKLKETPALRQSYDAVADMVSPKVFVDLINKNGGNPFTLDILGNSSTYIDEALSQGYSLDEAIRMKVKLFTKANLSKNNWIEDYNGEPEFGLYKDISYSSALTDRQPGGKLMDTIINLNGDHSNITILHQPQSVKGDASGNFITYAEEKAAIDIIETLVLDIFSSIQDKQNSIRDKRDSGKKLTLEEEHILTYNPKYTELKDVVLQDLEAIRDKHLAIGNNSSADFITRIIEDLNTLSQTSYSTNRNGEMYISHLLDENSIWLKTINKLSRDYKIDIGIEDVNEDDDGKMMKKLFDKYSADTSVSENVGFRVKQLLRGLTFKDKSVDGNVTVYNEFTGVPEVMNVKFVINTIQSKTANVLDAKQFKTVLDRWSKEFPYLEELVDILNNDYTKGGTLLNSLFYNLHSVRPEILINVIRGKSNSNVDSSGYIANQPAYVKFTNKIITEIKFRIINNEFDKDWFDNVTKIIKLNKSKAATSTLTKRYNNLEAMSEILKTIGVNIPETLIQYIVKNEVAYKEIMGITGVVKKLYLANESLKTHNEKIKEQIKKNIPYKQIDDILDVNPGAKSSIYGYFRALARALNPYDVNAVEEMFINAEGTNEYALRNASWVDKFFSMVNNTDTSEVRRYIRRLDSMGKLKNSNWIEAYDMYGNLNEDLAIKSLRRLKLRVYGGNRHSTGKGSKYMDTTQNEWLFDLATFYIEGIREDTKEGKKEVHTMGVIMSDSERNLLFRHKHHNINKGNNLTIDSTGYAIFKDAYAANSALDAMYKIVNREIQAMIQARDTMFNKKDAYYEPKTRELKQSNGTVKTVDDTRGLVKQYHWNGKSVLSNDKVTGNVFKFQSIDGLHDALKNIEGLFNHQGIITLDANFDLRDIIHEVDDNDANNPLHILHRAVKETTFNAINSYMVNEIIEADKLFSDNKDFIVNKIKNYHNNLNTHMHNEPIKFNRYRNSKGEIIRSDKQIYDNFVADYAFNSLISLAEQQNLFMGATQFYKNFSDTNKRAKELVSPARIINSNNDLNRAMNITILKDVPLHSKDIKVLAKNIKDAQQSESLIDSYNETGAEITDGQGYITVKGYANWLIGHGRNDLLYRFFDRKNGKYVLKKNLNTTEMRELLQPIKPFYYNTNYNSATGIIQPFQIKPSFVLLHDDVIKGTVLEQLRDKMDSQDIEIAVFESAVKVGAFNINSLDILDSAENLEIVTLDRHHLGDQVDIINHHLDTQIKAGIQIFKLIDTLQDDVMYDETTTLREHYQSLIGELLDRSHKELTDVLHNDITDEELANLLLELAGDEINDSMKALLQVDANGKFTNLLELIGNNKWQSLLTSKFTNSITNLKVPGMHNVMVSNWGMDSIVSTKNDSIISDKKYGTRRLKMLPKDEQGRYVFEALVPAWSKDFYNEDGTPILIEDLSEDLRTMIAYRIPTSAPHSAFVIKIVGFLPNDMGSTIIVPDEIIARTGADFDIDTLYINRKTHRPLNDGSFVAQRFEKFTEDDLQIEGLLNGTAYDRFSHKWALFREWNKRNNKTTDDTLFKALSDYRKELREIYKAKYEDAKITDSQFETWISKLESNKLTKEDRAKIINRFTNYKRRYMVAYSSSKIELEEVLKQRKELREEFDKLNEQGVFKPELKERYENLTYQKNLLTDELKKLRTNYAKYKERYLNKFNKYKELRGELTDINITQKDINNTFNETKGKSFETFKNRFETLRSKYVNDIDKYQQHNNDTLYSELVDVFDKYLNNPELLYRTTKPAEFGHLRDISVEAETSNDINPNLFSTQVKYRSRGKIGKKTIGIFANTNTGLSEMSKMKARYTEGVSITYEVSELKELFNIKDKETLKAHLIKRYGEIIINSDNTITIVYTGIGHTYDGTGLSIYNEYILDSYGAFVDNAADTVKERLPEHLTENNINILTSIGITGDYKFGIRLINQYASIVFDKAMDYNKSQLSSKRIGVQGKAESDIVFRLMVEATISEKVKLFIDTNKVLINELVNNNGYPSNIANWTQDQLNMLDTRAKESNSKNNTSYLTLDRLSSTVNKYDKLYNYGLVKDIIHKFANNEVKVSSLFDTPKLYNTAMKRFNRFIEGKEPILLFNNDILNDVKARLLKHKQPVINSNLKKYTETYKNFDTLNSKQRMEFYANQLFLIEPMITYNNQGSQLTDVILKLNYDKKGAGKSFYENRLLYESVQDHMYEVSNGDKAITVTDEQGNDLITAIYGDKDTSINKILYSYYTLSNEQSYNTLSAISDNLKVFKFTALNPVIKQTIDNFISILNLKKAEQINQFVNNVTKVLNFNHIVNTSNSGFYQLSNDEINRILGINQKLSSGKTFPSIDEFRKLSLSQQLYHLKRYDKGMYGNKAINKYDIHHIINYLTPSIDPYDIKNKGFHYIAVEEMSNQFELTNDVQSSYNQLMNSEDAVLKEYEREVAKNMLPYNVYRFGLQSGDGSFGYMIPTSTYNDSVMNINPDGSLTTDEISLEDMLNPEDLMTNPLLKNILLNSHKFIPIHLLDMKLDEQQSFYSDEPIYVVDIKGNEVLKEIVKAKDGDVIELTDALEEQAMYAGGALASDAKIFRVVNPATNKNKLVIKTSKVIYEGDDIVTKNSLIVLDDNPNYIDLRSDIGVTNKTFEKVMGTSSDTDINTSEDIDNCNI